MDKSLKHTLVLAMAVATLSPVFAQSTVGGLVEKGGRQSTKDDFLALIPMKLKWQWPTRQGEEELVLSADGKIAGTGYHYSSKTTSPVNGNWKVDDDGKICAPKTFTNWGSSTNMCWYGFELGNERFASLKNEPDSKLLKITNLEKLPN